MKIQNFKTSAGFLKKGKHLGKEKFTVYLSDLISTFTFSEQKALLPKTFSKRQISILSIYINHLEECIRQVKS